MARKICLSNYKKIFILCLSVFVLTGCSVDYDLYVGEKLTDNIFLYEDSETLENLDYYDMNKEEEEDINYLSYQIYSFEDGFNYEREEISKESVSGYQYNYTYNDDKISEKSMIYDCYKDIKVERKNKYIIIETSNEFKCFDKYPYLDEVNVNIHYSGKLINTNADSYSGGVYSWNINKNNYNDSRIYLEVKRNSKNYTFDIIGGIVFFVLVIGSLFVIHRKKNNYVD